MVRSIHKLNIIEFIAALVLMLAALTGVVSAAPEDDHKVTICHRTNSVNNPYNQQSVDDDSADGNTDNDSGKGDHSEHTGQVVSTEAEAQALKDAKVDWGDIIPPHDNYAGLNWTTEGQAVYNAGCNYPTPGRGGENPTPPTTTTTTPTAGRGAQTVVPQGAVAAGGGGATDFSLVAAVGLGGSILTAAAGLALAYRQRLN